MTDLIARIESADGPDREIDADIFAAIHPEQVPDPVVTSGYGWRFDRAYWWLATGEDSRVPPKTVIPPRYTASIDAALTLVPEGYDWAIFHTNGGLTIHAWCGDKTDHFGATPALALCIAALRAQQKDTNA